MPMIRYTIDPAAFTDGQWEELYNASKITPRTMEARHSARPFRRDRKYIELAIESALNRAAEVADLYGDEPQWAEDLKAAAETLRTLIGPRKPNRKRDAARLLDLLTSDIYTDADEYADRVSEVYDLLYVLKTKPKTKGQSR